ncbi:MAG: PAS domain S-box protein [Actinomycetota bacterium]|nr:PAS domain S-box protein [Actinomycetota bacterium]
MKKYSDRGIWVSLFDHRGQVIFWSEEAEKISGYSQDKLHGNDRVWPLLFPDEGHRQQVREAVSSAGKDGGSSMEVSISDRSGQPVRLIWNILDLSGLEQDKVTLVMGKRVSGEQEQLQGLGAVFADSLPHVAYIKDRDGRFVYANDSLCRLLGLERGQILGKKNSQLWPEPVAGMLGKNDRQVMAQKKLHSFQETVGDNQTFLSFKFPLNGAGRDLLGGISIDISERIEEEESLKRSRQRYEQTLSLLPDVVLETDSRGKITFLNQAARENFRFKSGRS